MTDPVLKFKKLRPRAWSPIRYTDGSAGVDLSSPVDITIPPRGWITLPLDLAIELPPGCYGRIAPRSGLAATHGITVDAGVVDLDFTGNLAVVLVNRSTSAYDVHIGQRIAQLICEKCEIPKVQQVDVIQNTERGTRGLGSSSKPSRFCMFRR